MAEDPDGLGPLVGLGWIERRDGPEAAGRNQDEGEKPGESSRQACFMGRPQQIFWAIATFPHFAQRNPAIAPAPSP